MFCMVAFSSASTCRYWDEHIVFRNTLMQAQILLKTLVDKLVISAEGMTEIELFGVPDVTREVFVITVSLNGEGWTLLQKYSHISNL